MLSQVYALLLDRILPQLKRIEVAQREQREHSESIQRNIEDLRVEMQIRFAELRAEIAACSQEIEDAMVTVRERDDREPNEARNRGKKRLVH